MDEVPSWMTPQERVAFWAQVAEVNRQAWVEREGARLVAASSIPRWLWRIGGLVGRLRRR